MTITTTATTTTTQTTPIISISRLLWIVILLIVQTHIVFLIKGAIIQSSELSERMSTTTDEFEFQPTLSKSKVSNDNITTLIDPSSSSSSITTSTTEIKIHTPSGNTSHIPLLELVEHQQNTNTNCKRNNDGDTERTTMIPMKSIIMMKDENIDTSHTTRMIPKVIHIAVKSRCLPMRIQGYILSLKNRLERRTNSKYSLMIHDETSVNQLLQKSWIEFPHLQRIQSCLTSGKAKHNLWRFLVLWEYGGIYIDWISIMETESDFNENDNNNNDSNNNNETEYSNNGFTNFIIGQMSNHISKDDNEYEDAILFYDPANPSSNNNQTSILSDVILTSSHHPLMHSAILTSLSGLLFLQHVGSSGNTTTTTTTTTTTDNDAKGNNVNSGHDDVVTIAEDIIATESRVLVADIFRVFLRRNHNHQAMEQSALKCFNLLHNDTQVFTGIGNRKLRTIPLPQTPPLSIPSSRPKTKSRKLRERYELPNNPPIIARSPGQNHYDMCVQYLYKQDAQNLVT